MTTPAVEEILPEEYRNGSWEQVEDSTDLPVGSIIRGPADMIGGDLIARVVQILDGATVNAHVTHVLTPTVNGRTADELGGIARGDGSSYTFLKNQVRRWVPAEGGWVDIDHSDIRVGMHVRGVSLPDRDLQTAEGEVVRISGMHVFLSDSPGRSRRLDFRTWQVREEAVEWHSIPEHALRVGMHVRGTRRPNVPGSVEGRMVSGTISVMRGDYVYFRGQDSARAWRKSTRDWEQQGTGFVSEPTPASDLPEWARGKTLDQVKRWIHATTVEKYAGGDGPFCQTGGSDFLDTLELPGLNETYPEVDETEQVREFVALVRESIISTGRQHSYDTAKHLAELGFAPRRRQVVLEVAEDVDVDSLFDSYESDQVRLVSNNPIQEGS